VQLSSSEEDCLPACPAGLLLRVAPDPPQRLALLLPEPVCMCYQVQVLPAGQGKLQQLSCVGCGRDVGQQRQQRVRREVC
jgi:hypothetical protein